MSQQVLDATGIAPITRNSVRVAKPKIIDIPVRVEQELIYMPVLTDEIIELSQLFAKQMVTIEQPTECDQCTKVLHIQHLDTDIPYGPYVILFPDLPVYHCTECSRTLIPSEEVDAIKRAVGSAAKEEHIESSEFAETARTFIEDHIAK